MLHERLVILRELLSETGSVYVHLDEHVHHSVKLLMDDVFGSTFKNDIVVRSTFAHADAQQFGSVHQTILFYTRGANYRYAPVYVPYDDDYIEKSYRYKALDGRRWLSCRRSRGWCIRWPIPMEGHSSSSWPSLGLYR
jgi:adenine-specific DNA-methyltransferase